jgi:hypothetical protein
LSFIGYAIIKHDMTAQSHDKGFCKDTARYKRRLQEYTAHNPSANLEINESQVINSFTSMIK